MRYLKYLIFLLCLLFINNLTAQVSNVLYGKYPTITDPQGFRYPVLSSIGLFPHTLQPVMDINGINPAALTDVSQILTGMAYQYNSTVRRQIF